MSEGDKPKLEIYLIVAYKSLYKCKNSLGLGTFKRLVKNFTLTRVPENPINKVESSHPSNITVFSPKKGQIALASHKLYTFETKEFKLVGTPSPLNSYAYVSGNGKVVISFVEHGNIAVYNGDKKEPTSINNDKKIKATYFDGRFSAYGRPYLKRQDKVYYLTSSLKVAVANLALLEINPQDPNGFKDITETTTDIEDFTVDENEITLYTTTRQGSISKFDLKQLKKSTEPLSPTLSKNIADPNDKSAKYPIPTDTKVFTALLAFEDLLAVAICTKSESKVGLALFDSGKLNQITEFIMHPSEGIYPIHVLRTEFPAKKFRIIVAMGVYHFLSVYAVRQRTLHAVILNQQITKSYLNNCELTEKNLICTGQNAVFFFSISFKCAV